MYKFSPTTGGFYSFEVNGSNIPDDAVDITEDLYKSLLMAETDGKIIDWNDQEKQPFANDPPPESEAQILAKFINKIQKRLDDFAKTRGYDGCLSCCTYADSEIAKFAAEGQYMRLARDQHWNIGYQIITDVQAGNREVPTLEQFFIELGPLEWEN